MKAITYKGKHSELCKAVSQGDKATAMPLIYEFFRSEDNTDSYSASLLTIVRELLEDGDSDEMYRTRIRMRSSGDRVFINLAQFVHALSMGGFEDAAEILAEKCLAELPKLNRSMHDFAEEEGLSKATDMAGLRIREAVRILRMFFKETDNEDALDACDEINLEMSRVFLFTMANVMSEDLMIAARWADRTGREDQRDRYCHEMVEAYGDIVEKAQNAQDFVREDYETLVGLQYAYETLYKCEHVAEYEAKLKVIQGILQ